MNIATGTLQIYELKLNCNLCCSNSSCLTHIRVRVLEYDVPRILQICRNIRGEKITYPLRTHTHVRPSQVLINNEPNIRHEFSFFSLLAVVQATRLVSQPGLPLEQYMYCRIYFYINWGEKKISISDQVDILFWT